MINAGTYDPNVHRDNERSFQEMKQNLNIISLYDSECSPFSLQMKKRLKSTLDATYFHCGKIIFKMSVYNLSSSSVHI